MKYIQFTPDNRITENLYKIIYRILIDNYFRRNPTLLIDKDKIDTKEAYNNWVNTILTTDNYYINIYYDNDKIIGFIAYMYKNNELCLSEVQIDFEYQGKNKLKEMLKIVYDNSNKNYYDIIYGTINKSNIKSQEVFTHIGMINTTKNRYEITKEKFEKWLKN